MEHLPNGCRVSNFVVFPNNWKTANASLAKPWYCKYRFYDSTGAVKSVMIKGINRLKTAKERREVLAELIKQEKMLLANGYNPITGQYISETPYYGDWLKAIESTAKELPMAETTRQDFDFRIWQVIEAAKKLRYHALPVDQVKKRHVKEILKLSGSTPYAYNKQRAYLSMIYKELSENEVVETNFVRDISKQKITRKLRETLTMEERIKVDQYLKEKHYTFWRYLHIFFHSGCRSTELLSLKRSDVNLEKQYFKSLVKKGSEYREVNRTIKDIALPFWQELLSEPGEILFSHGLRPGDKILRYDTITKNWWKWVKKPLGINATFYSLKHSHTTEVVDLLDEKTAADHNAHTSTTMVVSIYDVGREKRQHDRIKKLNNPFT